jgi:hypothetical protein
MLIYGTQHCDPARIVSGGLDASQLWNFDGMRAILNVASFTGDPSWFECVVHLRDLYLGYVFASNGQVPSWRVFAAGLLLDWRRTQDEQTRQAIILLSKNATFHFTGGGADQSLSLETANLINLYLAAEEVGEPQHVILPTSVDFALGHLDQWRNGLTQDFPPYLAAITVDALINWHTVTRDPRIPPAVELALNWLWNSFWNPSTQHFPSIVCLPGSTNPDCAAPDTGVDLNLMFAPAYGWLAKQTGNPIYRERATLLFNVGAAAGPSFLFRGKIFSQNYSLIFGLFSHLGD